MKRNTKNIINQYLLIAFIMGIMIGSAVPLCYGDEDRKIRYGFSIHGGWGPALYDGPTMRVYGAFPRITLPLYKNLNLEFEGNFSYFDISKKHDFYFLGINGNLLFKPIQKRWGSFFLLGGGGMGYDSAGKKLKQIHSYYIGDQHLAATLQGGAGLFFNIGRGTALRLEYRFYHISEPFKVDMGLNSHTVLLGISF